LARPPATQTFAGAAYDFTRVWVGLVRGIGATTGSLLYAQPADSDGNFSIAGVPTGGYTLIFWDSALNVIIAFQGVNVTAPAPANVGVVPAIQWFTRLYHYV